MVLVLFFFGLFSYTRVGAPEQVSAATSSNLNFQGRLLTDGGNVVPDGYYNLEFKLFNASSSSGSSEGSCAGDANCLWTETRDYPGSDDRVRTVNGYFSVNLGSVTSLPDINWDQDLWLTMNVGGNTTSPAWDGEMSPRVKLTSVPFAQAAKNIYSSDTNGASTNSDNVSISTGDALGTTSNSGNITLDVGTATGTAGTISVGIANTSGITIGYVGVLTDIGGDLTVSGSQFTNDGSTLNTAQSLSDFPTGGAIGTADATVDVATTFTIAQTTASQTLSLPDPTDPTAGRTVYVVNTGTTSFNMHSVTILNGYGQVFIWNGTAWVLAASGGSSGTVSLQGAYDGGNTLVTGNNRDINVTLADTSTDSNFIIDIASGSTGELVIQSNSTDVLQIGAAGQLQLDVQGSSGGILFGTDANLYHSGTGELTTDGDFITGGDLTIQGGDLLTNQTTFNLLNTTATTINFGGAATTLNIGPGGATATSINFAGGSGATGCTVDGSNGNLTCAGNITSTVTTGTVGYWSRDNGTSTLQPATAGDNITTSGNISTSGSGTITSVSTITGTTLNGTTGVNTGAGAGTQRIDASGNLVNIGDVTTVGSSTFTATGENGFIFKPGTDNTAAFQLQNASGTSLFRANTDDSEIIVENATLLAQDIDAQSGTPATISRINRTSDSSSEGIGTASFTPSGTFTPNANRLLVAYVFWESQNQDMATDGSDVTISDGSLTWVPITGQFNRNDGWGVGHRAFYAYTTATPPSNMQVTVDAGSEQVEKYHVAVDEMDGVDSTTPVAGAMSDSRQSDDNDTWSDILSASPEADDWKVALSSIEEDTNDVWDVPTGWSEIHGLGETPDTTVIYDTGVTSTTLNYDLGDLEFNANTDTTYGGFVLKAASSSATINLGATNATQINVGSTGTSILFSTGTGGVTVQGSNSATAFRVQDSGASNTLLTADTSNNRIIVGDGDDASSANTTLFVVDSASTTNAPTGVNGGIYYDTTLDRFRCFQDGSWTDCVTSIGTTVTDLQSAYDGGNTITTTEGNDIDVTLSDTTTDANFIIDIASGSSSEFKVQNNGSDVIRIGGAGHLFAGGTATATTATTSGTGTDTTTLTFTGTTSFANNDVIFIDNSSGQDYYTRIVSGGTAASVTVSPAVTFENGVTVTRHAVQNIGSNINGPPSSSGSQFFQGYFTGGIVAGSTTYSDGNIQSAGITLQDTSDSTAAFLIQNSSGTNLFQVDAANNRVYIGNSTADSTGTLLILDTKNTSNDPTGVNGALYYNSSIDKFRCFENGAWANCGTLPTTGFFQDGTNDTLSDANTDLWDAGTYPNLTITNDNNTILVSVVIYGTATGNDDEYDVFTIHRAVGSNPTCASTQVGTGFVAYTTNSSTPLGSSATFVDTPATTGDIRYTICSSTDAVGNTVDNTVDVISITLQESGS
ncbi:MAG TPA: hypothetical protein VFX79_01550 [Candidatus Saccharimonadales bacterium]|nr:hypothetical protein [Candidatus Saccharimonadales bacterium]